MTEADERATIGMSVMFVRGYLTNLFKCVV